LAAGNTTTYKLQSVNTGHLCPAISGAIYVIVRRTVAMMVN